MNQKSPMLLVAKLGVLRRQVLYYSNNHPKLDTFPLVFLNYPFETKEISVQNYSQPVLNKLSANFSYIHFTMQWFDRDYYSRN